MKLFVGNLPWSVDSEGLRQLFEDEGFTVDSASVVQDRMTQRSRGFGFVETPDGQAAIDRMSQLQIEGRDLTINEARPQTDRGDFRGGAGGAGGGRRNGGGGGGGGRRDRY